MNGDSPAGWAKSPVGELFSIHGGGTPDRGNPGFWNGGIPWLSSGDIKTSSISKSSETITKRGLEESAARLCRKGSVLVVVRSGILKHTLPVAVLEREAAINQDIKAFDSGNDQLNSWLALAWRATARELLAENREGTTVQSVKLATLQDFELPIPPLAEQQRIIAKLEKLMAKVDTCQERLAKVPTLLKRFRQSVLAAACSGRLTADWREGHASRENYAEIVSTIRHKREVEARTSAQREKLKEIYEYEEENDSKSLPDGWGFVALAKICESFNYGTSTKSQRTGKVPVLRMGNIQNGKIDWHDLAYTSDESEIQRYRLRPKTVLFNRTNSPDLVGKTAIYLGERPAIFAGYLIRVNQCRELDPEYLNLCLNTNYAADFCQSVKTDGVSQSNINAQKLGRFELPFCRLAEQQEIVRRVEKLFALADQIEARFIEAKKRVDSIAQSILAKAFSGELVPTEYKLAKAEGRPFESAQELLEKVRRNGDLGKKLQGPGKHPKAASATAQEDRRSRKTLRRAI